MGRGEASGVPKNAKFSGGFPKSSIDKHLGQSANKQHKGVDAWGEPCYNGGMEYTTLEIVGMIVALLALAVPITGMVVLVLGLSATGMPCFGDTRKERK